MWRDEPHAGAAGIYYVIHMFRMSAFFLMAGFFGRMLVERRGATGFVKDRLKRVAVPLFLFGPVVLLVSLGGWALGALLLLLATYHYFVRFTRIGAILNGRRHPRPAQSPPADAAPAAG